MQTFLLILALPAVAFVIWNILAIPFSWSRRKMRLRYAGVGVVATLALILAANAVEDSNDRELGFAGSADRKAAIASGITDAGAWHQHQAALAAIVKAQDEADYARVAAAKIEAQKAAAEQAKINQAAQEEADAKAAAAKAEADKVAEEADQATLEQCRKDIQCWGEKAWSGATVRCPAFIEKLAKWDFQWTDGWTEPKFGRYRWKDQKKGIVTLIGDKAKMQNGFGAWKHVTYSCDYDPISETVLGVQAY